MNFSPIKAEKLLTFMHVLGFLKLTFKNAVKVNNTNKRKCSVTFTKLYKYILNIIIQFSKINMKIYSKVSN